MDLGSVGSCSYDITMQLPMSSVDECDPKPPRPWLTHVIMYEHSLGKFGYILIAYSNHLIPWKHIV